MKPLGHGSLTRAKGRVNHNGMKTTTKVQGIGMVVARAVSAGGGLDHLKATARVEGTELRPQRLCGLAVEHNGVRVARRTQGTLLGLQWLCGLVVGWSTVE